MKDNKKYSENRFKEILSFSLGVMNGGDVKMLIDTYKETLDSVTPYDIVMIENRHLQMGVNTDIIEQ